MFTSGVAVACEAHPSNEATAICIICRKLLCDECRVVQGERYFCRDHKGVKVEQDWALVYQSSDINGAELTKAFLESVGLQVVVRNFTPGGFVWDGGSENPLSRVAINRLATVFVPIPEYLKARDALSEWTSAQET